MKIKRETAIRIRAAPSPKLNAVGSNQPVSGKPVGVAVGLVLTVGVAVGVGVPLGVAVLAPKPPAKMV